MSVRTLVSPFLAVAVAAFVASPAAALDRNVRIVNNTGFALVEFYGSNTGASTWEEDILGPDILYSGQSVMVNFHDGSGYCLFDFRAVFEDGDELVEPRVNVCEIGTFTYN
ncbi:hypothetical protein BYZ73_11195 [Rhodovulum viride]|uniref:Secreted protein n=1 Tax=Rhodovulum viride TaxID=1231134 RepID=A0ABX9DFV3_9RHOB|nr:hypothetical protein [Rhodovulum viride]RAP41237.1 hypothetical protein BYZ73_11195 [Rhodovulum viride]